MQIHVVISCNQASCTFNEALFLFSFSDKMGMSNDLAGIKIRIGVHIRFRWSQSKEFQCSNSTASKWLFIIVRINGLFSSSKAGKKSTLLYQVFQPGNCTHTCWKHGLDRWGMQWKVRKVWIANDYPVRDWSVIVPRFLIALRQVNLNNCFILIFVLIKLLFLFKLFVIIKRSMKPTIVSNWHTWLWQGSTLYIPDS